MNITFVIETVVLKHHIYVFGIQIYLKNYPVSESHCERGSGSVVIPSAMHLKSLFFVQQQPCWKSLSRKILKLYHISLAV